MNKSAKLQLNKIIAYAKKRMKNGDTNNIAICLGKPTNEQFNYLAKHFKSVRLEPFGYIRFES